MSGDGEGYGNQFRLMELERRMDESEEIRREYGDLLQAWKASKFFVRFILMLGAVIAATGASWVVVKTAIGLGPHP